MASSCGAGPLWPPASFRLLWNPSPWGLAGRSDSFSRTWPSWGAVTSKMRLEKDAVFWSAYSSLELMESSCHAGRCVMERPSGKGLGEDPGQQATETEPPANCPGAAKLCQGPCDWPWRRTLLGQGCRCPQSHWTLRCRRPWSQGPRKTGFLTNTNSEITNACCSKITNTVLTLPTPRTWFLSLFCFLL